MKATGIIRRTDDLGRIVIPKEIRRMLRIRDGEAMELYTDGNDSVIFKKYSPIIIENHAQIAAEALRKASIPFAIYDTTSVVEGNKIKFPAFVQDEWFNNRSVFTSSSTNLEPTTVFPVIVLGDLIGFIAIHGEQTEYAKAVAYMLAAEIAER